MHKSFQKVLSILNPERDPPINIAFIASYTSENKTKTTEINPRS